MIASDCLIFTQWESSFSNYLARFQSHKKHKQIKDKAHPSWFTQESFIILGHEAKK